MRRLLASVAALAAVLLAPSAALATPAPMITSPAPPSFYTQATAITLTWNSVGTLVTYRVFRDNAAGGTCPASLPGTATQRGTDMVDTLSFPDSLTAGNSYCYYVQAQDLVTAPADSAPLLAVSDSTPPAITAVTPTGADGCGPATFTVAAGGVAVTDASPVTLSVDTVPTASPLPYTPPDAP
ncbi:MAG: hypothetical protein QOE87_1926, partial [Gaiellales bacterium]|nr:hypothetical protein [Gaiellales bacterium]